MDGNRRWARKNNLSIAEGHKKGLERMNDIVMWAIKKEIKYITLWAFSTENWNRNKQEVNDLMNLFRKAIQIKYFKKIINRGAKIVILGDMSPFAKDIKNNVNKLINATKNNSKITMNIALNYGGRAEILRAVNQLLQEKKTKVNESEFSRYLFTKEQPDPDLIIRTGGEKRLSGYLPWQAVYSELYFTKTFWPAFTPLKFNRAIEDYNNRQRRFGQ